MEIVQSILTKNPCYTAGTKIKVKGLMLHSVGCPQPSAEVFVRQMNNAAAKVSVHAFIDGNTGSVYQTLPWDYKAWHCGGTGNSTHIGVEMCEPSCIKYTGGASFTCSNEQKARETIMRTLSAAVELFASLCEQYGLNPLADGVIISHKEGHDRGVASGHGDPDHLFRQLNMDYTMDHFRRAVALLMNERTKSTESTKKEDSPAVSAPDKKAPQAGLLLQNTAQAGPAPEHTTQTAGTVAAAAGNIQPGDMVRLAPDAVYATGKAIPGWVLQDSWIVKSRNGDRIVLGKNKSGSHEINSPVHIKHLTMASHAAGASQTASMQTQSALTASQKASVTEEPSTAAGEMTVSDRGVALIAKYEGCRLEAYKCPAGVWTIGYGHTAGVVQGQTLPSEEAAKTLLKEDLKKYGGYVNHCVKKGLITFSLNQNQFDALTSFCYNCGNGSLQKLVSGRNAASIAERMLLYNKGGGKELAGLTKRRNEERELFLSLQ